MIISRTAKFFLLLFSFGLSLSGFAKNIPDPIKGKRVYDYAGLLDRSEEYKLEQKILGYEDSTSNQFVILIEKSLEGDDEFSYTHRLAESWGIGQKGKNNGVLIAVFLKERRIRIQVGRGLEPVITDAESHAVIENIIKPAFRQKRYYAGFDESINALIKAASGEFHAEPHKGNNAPVKGLVIFILIIVVIVILTWGRLGGGGFGGGFMGGYMAGRMTGGGWGNFSSGGGGFSGGGFGGGSFGGGGSGGGW